MQPDLVDQVLFDEDFGGEVPRKRTTSVSKMDRKDSAVPEEEDDDERPPLVNGLPGKSMSKHKMYENNVALRSPVQIDRLRNSFCHFASHLSVKIEIFCTPRSNGIAYYFS